MDDKRFNEVYLPKYRDVIEALARKIARRDQDLYEDLVQVGMIKLWELEPYNATQNEDAWIRAALYKNMISARRKEKRRPLESLEFMIDKGAQIIALETGEPHLIAPRGRRRAMSEGYGDQADDE